MIGARSQHRTFLCCRRCRWCPGGAKQYSQFQSEVLGSPHGPPHGVEQGLADKVGCETDDEGFQTAMEDEPHEKRSWERASPKAALRAMEEGELMPSDVQGISSLEKERMAELRQRFPRAPSQELLRFCRARPRSVVEAAKMYEDYMEWRKSAGSAQHLEDAASVVGGLYMSHGGKAFDDTCVIHVQGARYDLSFEPESYVLRAAKAIDDVAGPDDDMRVTTLIDLRPGAGWPNPPGHKLLPFFKLSAATLPRMYPERMQRVIVYPMPFVVRALWRIVRAFFDPVTQDKFVILGGSASIGSQCPPELANYLSWDQLPEQVQASHVAMKRGCE